MLLVKVYLLSDQILFRKPAICIMVSGAQTDDESLVIALDGFFFSNPLFCSFFLYTHRWKTGYAVAID